MEKKIIRIHNPMMALPSFGFKGIEAYSTRAMTSLGGITIVADCGDSNSLWAAHDYLRCLGLGPDELILLTTPENGDLYQAVSSNSALCQRIKGLVIEDNYKIEFFCTRDDIESKFITSLGFTWSNVISHPSALADVWNNKSLLRVIAQEQNLAHAFPAYKIVNSAYELSQSADAMLRQYPEIVIKRPLWASGLGMVFGRDIAVAEKYLIQHNGVPAGTIVERSLGADHLAMSIVLRFEAGQVVDQWFTEQECPQKDGSVAHEGSILGDTPQVTTDDKEWMEQVTAPLYRLIVKNNPSLNGIINFDCLRYQGERFILECNARVTFSTYIQEIRRALLEKRGVIYGHQVTTATGLIRKLVPKSARDFESLRLALGSSLLTNPCQSGVIPIVLGCLATSNYCYLVSVADSYKEALALISEAKLKLEI